MHVKSVSVLLPCPGDDRNRFGPGKGWEKIGGYKGGGGGRGRERERERERDFNNENRMCAGSRK